MKQTNKMYRNEEAKAKALPAPLVRRHASTL